MKFSIKDFFSQCDQIRSFLRIWSHLLKKSLMENFIFCAVRDIGIIHLLRSQSAPKKQALVRIRGYEMLIFLKIWQTC